MLNWIRSRTCLIALSREATVLPSHAWMNLTGEQQNRLTGSEELL
jgi:hypothetical protein